MRLYYSISLALCFSISAFATNRDSLALSSTADLSISPDNDEIAEVYSYDVVAFEENKVPVDKNLFDFHVSRLEFVVPMDYNYYVKNQIDFFAISWQTRLKEVITRSKFYFPIYEEILDKNNMPLELKYLSVIESALNPYAQSRSGAVGPWQFMPATGRLFDLNQNYLMDERRSVEKSTAAAAAYLKSMYEMFGDWYVAIASYNCGPGNVRKAIRRSGRTDFWGMYNFLPRETQNYVPKFIAMAYIMNFYQEYGITAAPPSGRHTPYHPVYCRENMSFALVCDLLDISKEQLLACNPELKQEVIPQNSNGYWLNVPQDKVSQFYMLEHDIVNCTLEEDLAKKELAAAQPKVIYHKVSKGECLPIIARRYGCTVTQLKEWNNIRGSIIHPNQQLKIIRS